MYTGEGLHPHQIKGLNMSLWNSLPPFGMHSAVPYQDLSDLLGECTLL